MDPVTSARKHAELAEAEQRVVRGEETLAHQRHIITDLELHGHPTARSKALLTVMEQSQALHKEHRADIQHELESDSQ